MYLHNRCFQFRWITSSENHSHLVFLHSSKLHNVSHFVVFEGEAQRYWRIAVAKPVPCCSVAAGSQVKLFQSLNWRPGAFEMRASRLPLLWVLTVYWFNLYTVAFGYVKVHFSIMYPVPNTFFDIFRSFLFSCSSKGKVNINSITIYFSHDKNVIMSFFFFFLLGYIKKFFSFLFFASVYFSFVSKIRSSCHRFSH